MGSKEISAMTIEELDLSARTFNCFTRADAYTVQEILDLSKNHERARVIGNQAWYCKYFLTKTCVPAAKKVTTYPQKRIES